MLKSKATGKLAENRLTHLFTAAGGEVERPTGKFSAYDMRVKLGEHEFTVEVKYDVMAVDTGNIAIEFYNPKSMKASGLEVTTADIWAHCVKDGDNIVVFLCPVEILKKYVRNNPPKRVVHYAGDKNADLMLYDMDAILDAIFVRIDTVLPDKLTSLMGKML